MQRSLVMGALLVGLGACGVSKSKYAEVEGLLDECTTKLSQKKGNNRPANNPNAALAQELQPLVRDGLLEVSNADGRTTIGMKSEILFPSGSAQLSSQGLGTIGQLAGILAKDSSADWQIEGHTDSEPINTPEFPNNYFLGAARAIAVLDAMVDGGMSRSRVSAATFGDNAPVASNDNEVGRAQNRRIEVVLLPELPTSRRRQR